MRHIHLILPLLIIATACMTSSETGFEAYPVSRLELKSSDFFLRSGDREIFLSRYKTYHYAHIEWRSAVELSLNSQFSISEFEISPERAGVPVNLEGNAVRFTLDKPGYYMVRINENHRIFILADEQLEEPDGEVVNIMDYLGDRNGNTLVTAQLQQALDDISGSGKTLILPPGIYKTGVLHVRSQSKIHLEPGAVILGPDDIADLKTGENIRPKPFILIKDAKEVEITGRGIIDANGRYLRDKYGDEGRGRLLMVLNSSNVTIDGIIVRDPPSWNTHILYSEDVTIRNVKMLNDLFVSNTDGFDPDASRDVLIENCFAICGDDNVAIKSTGYMDLVQDVSNITIRNNVFLTKKSALKVGTESKADFMKNIVFENNDIIEADRGMTLYCYDGAIYDSISYVNNHFERSYPDRCQCGIHFRIRQRRDWSGLGVMHNILIKDCSFSRDLPNLAIITGLDEDHQIDLTIDNLTINGAPCTAENETSWLERRFAEISYK